MIHQPTDHFGGKTVPEHLKEARARGALASAEIHGAEIPGHWAAGADALKETSIALLILWVIFSHLFVGHALWLYLLYFSAGWILWKTGRSALLGWARIERLHRVIEEERWEIEHHRAQERQELTEMYRAKGLEGRLLEEVIDVLMADDNRLLRVMLEEELGLTLEVFEHPLKQASGACIGTLVSIAACLFGLWIFPFAGLPIGAALMIILGSVLFTQLERNKTWNTIIWNLALAGLAAGGVYLLIPLLS
jgi:hypothetical protein